MAGDPRGLAEIMSDRISPPAGSTWLARLTPAAWHQRPHWPRFEHWGVKLGEFFLAQGLLQILMFLAGFALLRWMPKAEYALLTFAFSVQGMMMTAVDLGIVGAIVPLVGARVGDRRVVGHYVAAGRQLRWWLVPVTLLVGGGMYLYGIQRHAIGFWSGTVLLLLILGAVVISLLMALPGAVLVANQRLRFAHSLWIGSYTVRVLVYGAAYMFGFLSAQLAVGLTTVLNGVQAVWTRRAAGALFIEPRSEDGNAVKVARAEILRFVRPQLPILLFNAMQGQIMILVVAFMGTTSGLADVGALSRLGQLFSFTPLLLSWIVQPYFARLGADLVLRRWVQVMTGGVACLALVAIAGFLFPEPFLWLLGPKYGSLSQEIGWMLAASVLGVGQALVSNLSAARKWVYDDAILWYAGFSLLGVGIGALLNDVSTPLGGLRMVVAMNVGGLVAYLLLAARGLRGAACDLPLVKSE